MTVSLKAEGMGIRVKQSDLRRQREVSRVLQRFERLVATLGVKVPRRDCTMLVDTASLYMRCGMIRDFIDELVNTRATRVNPDKLAGRAGRLWVEVDHLDRYSDDLRGPLDRFHTAMVRRRAIIRRGERKR
jgi:hypothetical protein